MNIKKILFSWPSLRVILVSLMLANLAAYAAEKGDAVGVIIAAQGDVVAVAADGNKRVLQRHAPFYLNDVITTAKNSKAQLKFNDETLIALDGGTKYAIKDFNFTPNKPQSSGLKDGLVEGSLMHISGQGNPENYVTTTPLSAISCRGTSYSLTFDKREAVREKFAGNILHENLLVINGSVGVALRTIAGAEIAEVIVLAGQTLEVTAVMEKDGKINPKTLQVKLAAQNAINAKNLGQLQRTFGSEIMDVVNSQNSITTTRQVNQQLEKINNVNSPQSVGPVPKPLG